MNILGGLVNRKLNVKEENGKLICLTHNREVNFMIQDDETDFSEIFQCQLCFNSCGSARKIISIQAAMNDIQDIVRQKTQKLKSNKIKVYMLLQQLLKSLRDYKSALFEKLITLEEQIEHWMNFTDAYEFIISNSLLDQLELYQKRNFDFSTQIEKFIQESSNFHTKVETTYGKLWENGFQGYFQQVICEAKQKVEELHQNVDVDQPPSQLLNTVYDKTKIETLNRVPEKDTAFSIAFNQAGTLLATGLSKNINIWAIINGKLEYERTLMGHRSLVTCLQFSKKYNQFISGSADGAIKCWKQLSVNSSQALFQTTLPWNQTEPDEVDKHSLQVTCLLLNKQEDELLSCSFDSYIKVWRVYPENNQIFLEYTLPAKHFSHILSMSLNSSETVLVSCGERDKMIVMWTKRTGKWEYVNSINTAGYGNRICFINETQFIWAQNNQSIIKSFTIKGLMMEEDSHEIKLTASNGDFYLFPATYNVKKGILLFKHGSTVYLLKEKIQRLQIDAELSCGTIQCFGALSDDGTCLALYKSNEIILYKILY